jgi:hypothetical protein
MRLQKPFVILIALILFSSIFVSNGWSKGITYNRGAATQYATQHCGSSAQTAYNLSEYVCYNGDIEQCRNDNPWLTSNNHVDCANFVSQSVINGGLSFQDIPGAQTIGRAGSNKAGTKGFPSVNALLPALLKSFCFEIITDPEEAKKKAQPGDILSSKQYSHVMLYTGSNAYSAHTSDRCEYTYSTLWQKNVLYHFKDDDKCKKCEQDDSTHLTNFKDKCDPKCETCDPNSGACNPINQQWIPMGRCSQRTTCDTNTGQQMTNPGGPMVCGDDTLTVGTGIDWAPLPSTNQRSAVGVLKVGFTYNMVDLLRSFKEDVRVVNPDEISPALVQEMPLLIIPSAGLYGMEQSMLFKSTLEAYVNEGGSVLVMGQHYGYAYASLPGDIDGYGWLEDQMCFANSSYITTWHPVLAGQTRSTPSIGVDGYFTKYPDNTTFILRRTANGQPDLILYPFGKGYVLASSFYSDSAFSSGSASADEKSLIRDIVTWAKSPASITEVVPGQTVTVNINVKNNDTSTAATAAEIEVYDPDRKVRKLWTTIPVNLGPGESAQVPVSYAVAANDPVGIYHVNYNLMAEGYQLLTSEENPIGTNVLLSYQIQSPIEDPSARFAVTRRPQTGYQQSGITYAIQSDSFAYINNSTGTFTIKIWNNSDVQRTITAKYDDQTQNVTVGPMGLGTITYAKTITWGKTGLTATFYDETGKYLGSTFRNSTIVNPATKTSAFADKAYYAKGETVSINTAIQNKTLSEIRTGWQADVKTTIVDYFTYPYGILFEDTQTVTVQPSQTVNVTSNYILPTTAKLGTYTIYTYVMNGNSSVGWAYSRFEVAQSQISAIPSVPPSLVTGANTIPFLLSNTGRVDVHAGVIDVSLAGPDGSIVYSGSQPFALASGASITLNLPFTIPAPQFGNYILTYAQSDETRTGNPTTITIRSMATLAPSFDKPSYRIRETANLVVDAVNTGRFNLENTSLTVSAQDLNFSETMSLSLIPNTSVKNSFAIPIPDTVSAGSYPVTMTLALPSGGSVTQTTQITIPYPSFTIDYTGPTSVKVGDTISISVENTGGVDSNATSSWNLRNIEPSVYQDSKTDTIRPGEMKTYSFTVPLQTVDGEYILYADVYDPVSDSRSYFNKPLTIAGVKAGLFVKTDKDIYLNTENILAMSTIANQTYPLDSANLHLQIVNKCYQMPASYYIATWDGSSWVDRGVLHYPVILDTQIFDLSRYLPDVNGEYKVRIRQQSDSWRYDYAAIDYISLRIGGIDYQPVTAVNLTYQGDILYAIGVNDGILAEVPNNEIEVAWTGLPTPADAVLIMKAREGNPYRDEACTEQVIWDADIPISQAANSSIDLSRMVNPLYPSQYYLQGILRSRTDTVIARAEYPFAVVGGDFAALLRTDKDLYRPGETITFTGTAYNLTDVDAAAVTVNIYGFNDYSETFDIPARGIHVFSFTATAPAVSRLRTYQVYGYAEQNGYWLADIRTAFKVDVPVIYDGLDAPYVVGEEPFHLNVFLDNTANSFPSTVVLTASGGTLADTRTITLQPGELKTVEYTQSITADTTYTFELSGDLEDILQATVIFGESAEILLNPEALYPEGKIAVPVTINNTGWFEELITVNYQLTRQSVIISQQTKAFYVAGDSMPDTLYFDLPEGDYQLTATSLLPAANAQAIFSVRKSDNVQMTASLGATANGLFPVTAVVTNLGLNAIAGSVHVSMVNNQGTSIWNGEQIVPQLPYQNSMTFPFTMDAAAVAPGSYAVQVALLDNGGRQVAVQTLPLTILGPTIQLTQTPPYQTFSRGQDAAFVFTVKNIGNQAGEAALHLKAYDLIDATQQQWLMPGEEKDVTFNVLMPLDLEENDYVADYEFNATSAQTQRGQAKYHLAGINIQVNATLDKQNYSIGDTAHLAITLNQQPATSMNLYAQVVYGSYESQQSFTLNGSQTLTFDIPVAEITGQKLFYGIYLDSGRSVHLNSLYIYEAGAGLVIITDRQVYNPGETVAVTVSSQQAAAGNLTLTGPNYSETFAFTGTASKSFALPSNAGGGTYFINAELQSATTEPLTAKHPIDVAGIQVKVTDARLDKGKYNPTDSLIMAAKIQSNTTFVGTLKTAIIDPDNAVIPLAQTSIGITSPQEFPYSGSYPLSTAKAGMHKLMYSVYSGDLLLASGTLAFDVGEATLLGIWTDKDIYPTNTEPVAAKVSLYGIADTNLELQLDGTMVKTEPVALNGFATLNADLGTVPLGSHVLKAVLTTGGLTSAKETNFTIRKADSIPPVTTATPGAGLYGPGLNVTLATNEPSTIYYTTDGTIPTTNSTVYSAPIPISGTTTLQFFAVDTAGNPETVNSAVYTIDSTPPTGSILANSGALYTNNSSVTLTLSCTDTISGCAQMQFSSDNITWLTPETYASTKAWVLASGDGQKTAYVKYIDGAGNMSAAYSAGITLDTVPPMTLAIPGGGFYNAVQSVTLVASEAAMIYYTTNGTIPTTGSPAYTGPITITETMTLQFFAVDLAGNSEVVTSTTYTIDTQAPLLTVSTLPNGSYTNNATLNIAGTVTDNIGVQGVTINETAVPVNADGTFSQALPLMAGSNKITTVAKDKAGNTTTDERTIILDQTAPMLVITNPADNSVTNIMEALVTGTVDETSTVVIKVNGGSPLPATMTGTNFSAVITLTYGQNTIEVTATDQATNTTTGKRTVVYDNISPALAVTNPAQDITTSEPALMLQGTASDLTALTVTVKFDGTIYTPLVVGGTFEQPLAFQTEKTYAVIVTATDAAGNTSTVQRNIMYQKTSPPVGKSTLVYTGSTFIARGRAVTLSGMLKVNGTEEPNPYGQSITFTLGTGSTSQSCTGTTDSSGNAICTISSVTVPIGSTTVTAIFNGDVNYQPSSDSKNVIVFGYPANGSFVIGDKEAAINNQVMFWGAQWWKNNRLSGGFAPASFKGFADVTSTTPPVCGGTWITDPGNCSDPPSSIPAYMAVLVASKITKAGNKISGNIPEIVIVKTNGGYGPNPGHPGTGTVVGVLCNQ